MSVSFIKKKRKIFSLTADQVHSLDKGCCKVFTKLYIYSIYTCATVKCSPQLVIIKIIIIISVRNVALHLTLYTVYSIRVTDILTLIRVILSDARTR